MNTSAKPHGAREPLRFKRDILIYDLLLVLVNAGFVAALYYYSSVFAALTGAGVVDIADAAKITMLAMLWCVGNAGLLIGLIAANRRDKGARE